MTREQAAYYMPFIQAWADKQCVQWKREGEDWKDVNWFNFPDFDELGDKSVYAEMRIKHEPQHRKWTAKEVVVGGILRSKMSKSTSLIVGVNLNSNECVNCYGSYLTLEDLFLNYEVSYDNCKTWQPCGVPI